MATQFSDPSRYILLNSPPPFRLLPLPHPRQHRHSPWVHPPASPSLAPPFTSLSPPFTSLTPPSLPSRPTQGQRHDGDPPYPLKTATLVLLTCRTHYSLSLSPPFTAFPLCPLPTQQAQGGIDVLLATAPSASAMTAVLPVLAKAGTLVLLGVGGHDDCTVLVDPGFLIAGRRKVMGFPSGQPSDAEDALRFAARHGIRPINEVFPASQASEAFDRMMSKQAIFRVVLDHAV
ncbi:unnamed protein product [Closterium sp. NIES-54]